CGSLPGSGTSAVTVFAGLAGLTPNSAYHFRVVASNAGGTSSGPDRTFTTLPNHPSVEAGVPSSLTQSSAALNATVNPNGGTVSDCRFEYGTSVFYEASVPCSSLPGSGSSPVAVSADVEGLGPSTTYHFRVVASNQGGTGSSTDQTFTTPDTPP